MHTLVPRNERLKFILESLVEGTLELKHADEKYISLIKGDIVARGYDIVSENEDN
jgi:hypothetical protein